MLTRKATAARAAKAEAAVVACHPSGVESFAHSFSALKIVGFSKVPSRFI